MKLSNLKSKAAALVLTIALCLTSIAATPDKAEAATEYDTILQSDMETAAPEETKNYTFRVTKNTPTYINIRITNRTDAYFNLTDGTDTYSLTIPAATWEYDNEDKQYYYTLIYNLSTTSEYTLSLAFAADEFFLLNVSQEKLAAKQSSITISVGLTYKLSVLNASGKVTWSSNNKKIATVDETGKVTAKKKGNATITAKDSSGAKATCKVTVKENKYTPKEKLTLKNAYHGQVTAAINSITYNSKKDLVIKVIYANRTKYNMKKVKNLKITVRNASKKVISTYSAKNLKANIKKGGLKTLTLTVKKPKTNQDLRFAKVTIDNAGTWY